MFDPSGLRLKLSDRRIDLDAMERRVDQLGEAAARVTSAIDRVRETHVARSPS